MASKYAGTKTEQNLKDAFSGESQARNKYTYYASAAKKAGYEQMSALYLETADQEKELSLIHISGSSMIPFSSAPPMDSTGLTLPRLTRPPEPAP